MMLLPSCTRSTDVKAGVVFKAGTIITLIPKMPRAEIVAIYGEHIVTLGSMKDIDTLRGFRFTAVNNKVVQVNIVKFF